MRSTNPLPYGLPIVSSPALLGVVPRSRRRRVDAAIGTDSSRALPTFREVRMEILVEFRLLFEGVHAVINVIEEFGPDFDFAAFTVRDLGHLESEVIPHDRVPEFQELADSGDDGHVDHLGEMRPSGLRCEPDTEFQIHVCSWLRGPRSVGAVDSQVAAKSVEFAIPVGASVRR